MANYKARGIHGPRAIGKAKQVPKPGVDKVGPSLEQADDMFNHEGEDMEGLIKAQSPKLKQILGTMYLNNWTKHVRNPQGKVRTIMGTSDARVMGSRLYYANRYAADIIRAVKYLHVRLIKDTEETAAMFEDQYRAGTSPPPTISG